MFEPLRAALRDENRYVRGYAASALGFLGDTRAVPELIDMLGDEHHNVRGFTDQALRRLGDERAIQPLRRAEREDPFL